jgi:predicted lipoprotein with Yx(FWY)xxD motif
VGSAGGLGQVLTNASGRTLYYFLPEKGGKAACTGGCAATWPPATVSGTAIPGSGVSGSLGVLALADGSSEVTYQQWPLHTYSGDNAPGDANGQGADNNRWFAATPGLSPDSSGPGAVGSSSTSKSSSSSSGVYGY